MHNRRVQICLGEAEARKFYTAPGGRGGKGLGWSNSRFSQVAWWAVDSTLASKPDRYGLWLSKQASGWCATRKQVAKIQDLLDDKCPTCQKVVETSGHLNRCLDSGRTQLFEDSVDLLTKWLHQDNRTDPELVYWIPKYLLFRGCKHFVSMGPMSPSLTRAGASQDEIGWVELLHDKVSVEIAAIQDTHCRLSTCRMNGRDWMKHFVSHLLRISHSQWCYRNFVLHNRTRGCLRLKARKEILLEIERLVDMDPDKVPLESQFLLEMDFDSLYNSSYEKQYYWVRAMKAARRAGRRTAFLNSRRSAAARRQNQHRQKPRHTVKAANLEAQIREEHNLRPASTRRRPHPSSIDRTNPCNKRLKNPD